MRSATRAVRVGGCILVLAGCGAPDPASAEPPAPTVVHSVPGDGEIGVDTELGAIRVTFSQAMQPEGWSWVKEVGSSAPVVTGIPFYIDELTNVLPVRLEPHTRYVVWVNSPDDEELRKFQSAEGVSARAYRIGFTTR